MYLMMIGIMMPRIIRTRDRISKSLIHIALLYESVKRGLFKKEVTLTFMRAKPSTVLWQHPNRILRFDSIVTESSLFDKLSHLTKQQNRFILKIQRVLPMNGQPSVYFKEIEPILLDKGRFISFYVCDYETVRSAL